jgi:PadR family transcriptional regulator, regulatory protein AphA
MGKENKSRYALLGMLSLGSMSGYDVKKTIEQSLGNFWHESYPQIYPMLKQLEQEGLATGTVERQEGRPDRHVYTLTEQGWDELKRWVSEPYELQYERNELLLKLFFGFLKPTEISVEHVRRHRAIQEGLLVRYGQIEAEIAAEHEGNPNLPYWLLTLRYGFHVSRALVAWCDEALAVLAGIKGRDSKK